MWAHFPEQRLVIEPMSELKPLQGENEGKSPSVFSPASIFLPLSTMRTPGARDQRYSPNYARLKRHHFFPRQVVSFKSGKKI